MTRERLEDAFTRAEGALDLAFWLFTRARRVGPQRAALRLGEQAYAQLERAAAKLRLDCDNK